MNTPAHILLNVAFLGNTIKPKFSYVIILGALVPDLPAIVFYLYEKFYLNTPEHLIWTVKYNAAAWKLIFNVVHSFSVSIVLIIGFHLIRLRGGVFFSLSVLLHQVTDFFLHNIDAHQQLLPFSDFKFISPVSYWDSNHYGQYFLVFEFFMSLFCFYIYQNSLKKTAVYWIMSTVLCLYLINLLFAYIFWS